MSLLAILAAASAPAADPAPAPAHDLVWSAECELTKFENADGALPRSVRYGWARPDSAPVIIIPEGSSIASGEYVLTRRTIPPAPGGDPDLVSALSNVEGALGDTQFGGYEVLKLRKSTRMIDITHFASFTLRDGSKRQGEILCHGPLPELKPEAG